MTDLDTFRAELNATLDEITPEGLAGRTLALAEHNWGGRNATWSSPQMRDWQHRMTERGWAAPAWPVRYGGAGWTEQQARLLQVELRRRRLPPPVVGIGLSMVGPAILKFGTEEQRERHLPGIARGEIWWCQGFSEPGAGSDLPSLSTRAALDGDRFRVDGQKVWTSHGHRADWILALVRTDPGAPERAGISCLLIDMATPGVCTRPMVLISGRSTFCETFFDDVGVPEANLLGERGRGWEVARYVLAHERGMLGGIVVGEKRSGGLAAEAAAHVPTRDGVIIDDELRRRVAALEIEGRAYRAVAAGKASRPADPNVLKLLSSELNQRRLDLRQEFAGLDGAGWSGEGFSDDQLALCTTWLRSRAYSIEGGTSEIVLNAIATRVLGLPPEASR
jgi:alkylation response protein AidB-like acyl-CoA dehydrogenase